MDKLDSAIKKEAHFGDVALGYPLPQQQLIPEAKPRSLRKPIKIIATVLAIAFLLLMYIYLHNTATNLGYEVGKRAEILNELQREYKSYELEALELHSMERIEEVARNKLGMDEPNSFFLKDICIE